MKQLLFILLLALTSFSTSFAQGKDPWDETTWNTIRERLFSGTNSKAYRFNEDIRIELGGKATEEDSSIVNGIILELNKLIESVEVKLVDSNGNFIINVSDATKGLSARFTSSPKNEIIKVEINVMSDEDSPYSSEKYKFFQYSIITNLTKTFTPRYGETKYYGFFDTSSFEEARRFTEIDKNLLKKLYSKNFYAQLRTNTIKKYSYLFYLNLRFEEWIKKISILIAIILIVLGFLFLLSIKPISSSKLSFWNYLKRGFFVLIGISIIYLFYTLPYKIPFFQFVSGYYQLFTNFAEVVLYGVPVLILIYYSDRLILKKIDNFHQQQIFVFTSTFLFIVLSYFLLSIPFVLSNSQSNGPPVNLTDHLRTTTLLDIAIISILRVFYNFINYRIQSMVNQKDVEIAKMKELKNQAELNALHSRINPHFLYNSLNSIASLAHIDADKTESMATGLSDLFRYSINKENKTYVSMAEELEMVKKYLEIEQTRFGNKLEYAINADENLLDKQIPKFLIQPLVENAVKHGLSKIKKPGKIIVEVKRLEKALSISIYDNGPDFPKEPVGGYGLQNLHDKLAIIYGDDAIINWENGEKKNFNIILKNQF